jgi:hypothetical protein
VVRRSETFGAVYASVGWIMDLTEYLRVLRKGGITRKTRQTPEGTQITLASACLKEISKTGR